MLGKVIKYDKVNEMGYIEGYDEIRYFYHQINVKNSEELKEGDIVNFEYLLERNEYELPYAINIVKETLNKDEKSKPYRELYEILKYLSPEDIRKIPSGFLKEIEGKMDAQYEYKIEHFQDFENQKMLDETRVLLAIVYRDYLASEEEKREILENEKEELIREEQEKREKYNPDNIFKARNSYAEENSDEKTKTALVKVKSEKWYNNVIAFFKKLFSRFK